MMENALENEIATGLNQGLIGIVLKNSLWLVRFRVQGLAANSR